MLVLHHVLLGLDKCGVGSKLPRFEFIRLCLAALIPSILPSLLVISDLLLFLILHLFLGLVHLFEVPLHLLEVVIGKLFLIFLVLVGKFRFFLVLKFLHFAIEDVLDLFPELVLI